MAPKTPVLRWLPWALLLLSFLARLPMLDDPLSEDEAVWAKVILHGTWEERFERIPHPPLAMLTYVGAAALGLPLKLVPLLLATLAAGLLYLAARRIAGETPALVALIAILASPLFTVGSMQLDIDGSFLLLGVAAILWSHTVIDDDRKLLWCLGILTGLLLLTKYTAVFWAAPAWLLLLRDAWRFRDRDLFVRIIVAGLLALAIFSLFPLLSLIGPVDHFAVTREHGTGAILDYGSWSPVVLFLILQAMLLLGPLLPLLSLPSLRKGSQHTPLPVLMIIIGLTFYLVIATAPGRPLERYLVPILAPLTLLAAIGARSLDLSWRDVRKTIPATVLFAVSVIVIERSTRLLIPFDDKTAYLSSGLAFLAPLRGSSGPFGFFVSSITLIAMCAIAAWLAFAWWRRSRLPVIGLSLLLVACLIISAEAVASPFTPDPRVASEVLEMPIAGPVLAHRNFGLEKYPLATTFWDDRFADGSLAEEDGTILLLWFPPRDGMALRDALQERCVLEASASDDGVLMAQRWRCG